MRAPITVMGPLLEYAAGDLSDLSLAALLVSLPLLAFSIAAPAYPLVLRRVGLSRSLQIALGVLAAGLALRQIPSAGFLLGGTIVAGAGIAALNVAMPVVVKARWPSRVGLVTGVHTSVVGATVVLAGGLAAMMTFALSEVSRASTTAATGWPAASPSARPARARLTFLHPTIRLLSALMALQAGTYYALVSWLPTILMEEGRSAAQVSGLQGAFVVLGVVSAPMAGLWLQSGLSHRALAVASTLPLAAALAGLALVPAVAPLWVALAGLACGAVGSREVGERQHGRVTPAPPLSRA